jgi:hypothetical protein
MREQRHTEESIPISNTTDESIIDRQTTERRDTMTDFMAQAILAQSPMVAQEIMNHPKDVSKKVNATKFTEVTGIGIANVIEIEIVNVNAIVSATENESVNERGTVIITMKTMSVRAEVSPVAIDGIRYQGHLLSLIFVDVSQGSGHHQLQQLLRMPVQLYQLLCQSPRQSWQLIPLPPFNRS